MTERLTLPIAPAPPATGTRLPRATLPSRPAETANGSPFREALRDAARRMAAREATLDRALRGGASSASPEQLLALQATVHRYAQEVELAAKLVDKLTGAVRQVLTSQQ